MTAAVSLDPTWTLTDEEELEVIAWRVHDRVTRCRREPDPRLVRWIAIELAHRQSIEADRRLEEAIELLGSAIDLVIARETELVQAEKLFLAGCAERARERAP